MHTRLVSLRIPTQQLSRAPVVQNQLVFPRRPLRHASNSAQELSREPRHEPSPPVATQVELAPVDYGFASTSRLVIADAIRTSSTPPAILLAKAAAVKHAPLPPGRTRSPQKGTVKGRPEAQRILDARIAHLQANVLHRGGSPFWEQQAAERREKEAVERLEAKSEVDTATDAMPEDTMPGVPTTPDELLRLMYKLRRMQPPASPIRLVEIHSHPSLTSLTSEATYAYVLRLAYRFSNLALARGLLTEMDDRGIEKGKLTCLALLYGFTRRADEQGVARMRQVMADRGWDQEHAVGERKIDYWRERRDLGDAVQGKGLGDRWKAWGRRGWGSAKALAASGAEEARQRLDPSGHLVGQVITEKQTLLRPRVPIPINVGALDGHTIVTLVDSLVQERRAPEAFEVVETWLDQNRPGAQDHPTRRSKDDVATGFPLDPRAPVEYAPAPFYVHARKTYLRKLSPKTSSATAAATQRSLAHYHSRALLLLNVLLKSLLMNYISPDGCRTFVLEFVERHSVVSHSVRNGVAERVPGIMPDGVTLRELLMNLRGRKNGWRRGLQTIEWFADQFGGLPGETSASFRRNTPSTSTASLSLLSIALPRATDEVDPSPTLTSLDESAPDPSPAVVPLNESTPPTSRVNLRIALLILNHATTHHNYLTRNSTSQLTHAREVRAWWATLRVRDDPEWGSRLTGDMMSKARRKGLLDGPEAALAELALPEVKTSGRRSRRGAKL